MKASEFRIGNWILPKMKEYKSEWKAVSLGPDILIEPVPIQVFPRLITRMVFNEDTLKMYEPIPLTEEWLLKFGFKLAGDFTNTRVLDVVKHAYDCSEIRYSPNEGLLRFSNGGIKGSTIIPYVKHVHQLQNLYFALTGEELIFKSEK